MKFWDGERWRKRVLGRPPKGWKGKGEPTPTPDVLEKAGELIEAERAARSLVEPAAAQGLETFLAGYREVYARRSASGSAYQLDNIRRIFLAWAAARGVTEVRQVTRAVAAAFLAHLAAEGRAHGTIKAQLGILSGAWSEAVKLGRLDRNPWLKLPMPTRAERGRKRGSWTPEQFERLVAAAEPWLRDILVLGTQTGLRITALAGVRWRDVEWPAGGAKGFGQLRVPPELDKIGVGYVVPLSRRAHELLARLFAERGDDGGPILRGKLGRPTRKGATALAITRACNRAGLPAPDSPNHHMRRSFGRWAIQGHLTGRPVPLYVVSRWLGHSSTTMTELYLDLDKDTSADWMEEA
jgi:integrase